MPAKRPTHLIYAPSHSEAPKKTKPTPSLWLAAFQLALTVGVIIGLIYSFLFIWQATSPKETVVPKIVGLDRAAAEILLKHAGLEFAVTTARPSENLEAGKVIEAQPAPGRRVKEGRKIDLILSEGSTWTNVPDIRGMSLRRAEPLLKEQTLVFGKRRFIFHAQLPKGYVVDQLPEPGTRVRLNSEVQTLISQGPRPAPGEEPAQEEGGAPTTPEEPQPIEPDRERGM